MKHKVLHLRPTQFALGMKEVDYRTAKIKAMKEKELEDYLHERRVPVVRGPRSRIYLVDHHHLIRSCWECGVDEVPIEVKADHEKLGFTEFWEVLREKHWIFPYDQFGQGPHSPANLPENIKGLADDPFR